MEEFIIISVLLVIGVLICRLLMKLSVIIPNKIENEKTNSIKSNTSEPTNSSDS